MGNKILVLVIACILVFPLGLIAKDKPGADLLIVKLDGEQVRGELIAVKESSLLLLSESGADVSVDVKEIKVITIVKKSKALLGAGLGYAIGVSSMIILSMAATEGEWTLEETLSFPELWIFSLPFALIGGFIGGKVGKSKTIQIEGKSASEIRESLEYLRNKARIPDYN
ncbi:hypothetical protein ACFLR7_03025 [Acidobacteriota bacterium]